MSDNILEVKNLHTSFYTMAGEVKAVNGLDFSVEKGKTLGIVGESGSGKSVTMLSIIKLLGVNGQIKEGDIFFNGENLVDKKEDYMRNLRGNEIGMIFQDPMTSLNPVLTIGYQICEPLIKHRKMSKCEAKKRAVELLKEVGIPDPENRLKNYPYEFSGGMRQRVMIAIAISCNPQLLIADEPTTALDVTIQAQILDLMKKLQSELDTSIIIITHDLGVVADIADEIMVMYGGNMVEKGKTQDIFFNPKHPYTRGLLNSVPNPDNLVKERLIPIEGQPPDLLNLPKGCPFSPRCPNTMKICLMENPDLMEFDNGQMSRCWLLYKEARAKRKVI
jgi:oligopeptide transport system ATP-binding protein